MMKASSTHKWLAVAAAMFLTACGTDDAAFRAASNLDFAGGHTAALKEGECDLDGTWAIKINVPVQWPSNGGLWGDKGELTQVVKAQRTRDGDTLHESLTVCGITLPDYRSRMWQRFGTSFPDDLFDGDYLSSIEVTSYFTGFTPGSTFETGSVVSELGVAMPSPLSDPWPMRGPDVQHAVDTDRNGHPGVTLEAKKGNGYSLPPTTLPSFNPAAKFYTAIRNIADISGTQITCDKAEGTATIPKIGNKLALNSHILGCELASGGQCNARQTKMLDDNQPAYELQDEGQGPVKGTVTMVRVDADITCKQIREYNW